jgi:hypothetical protein
MPLITFLSSVAPLPYFHTSAVSNNPNPSSSVFAAPAFEELVSHVSVAPHVVSVDDLSGAHELSFDGLVVVHASVGFVSHVSVGGFEDHVSFEAPHVVSGFLGEDVAEGVMVVLVVVGKDENPLNSDVDVVEGAVVLEAHGSAAENPTLSVPVVVVAVLLVVLVVLVLPPAAHGFENEDKPD